MRHYVQVLCLVCILVGEAAELRAQTRGARPRTRAAAQRQSTLEPRSRFRAATHARQARGLEGVRPVSGLRTRLDSLRVQSPFRNARGGLLDRVAARRSPISQLLESRNLLKGRSRLAKRSTALVGRQDYVLGEDGGLLGGAIGVKPLRLDVGTEPTTGTAGATYTDGLAERLKSRADAYFDLGLAEFRDGKYIEARQHFGLVAQLEPNRSRAFVAAMIASYQRADFSTASMNLVLAVKKAESLEDLRIDWRLFYSSHAKFQTVIDSINLIARSEGSAGLLHAFYAFLNGDLRAAVAAVNSTVRRLEAEKKPASWRAGDSAGTPHLSVAQRFLDLLTEAESRDAAR